MSDESLRYRLGDRQADFYARMVRAHDDATRRRRGPDVARAEDLPWERSAHGKLKHLAHSDMDVSLASTDAFILELAPGGRSGRHRHFAEEFIYVIEGAGHDLHWDPDPAVAEQGYEWTKPKGEGVRWDWAQGDSIFIPPMVAHIHTNDDATKPVRLLCAMSRVYETLGFGGIEQLEDAPPDPR